MVSIVFVILIGYAVIKVFFANLKRGGILLVMMATGSLYLFSVPRGYSDGFVSWCKQVAALCLTAFLQTIVPVSYTHLDVYKRQREYLSKTLESARENAQNNQWNGWFEETNWNKWQEHMESLIETMRKILEQDGEVLDLIPQTKQEISEEHIEGGMNME